VSNSRIALFWWSTLSEWCEPLGTPWLCTARCNLKELFISPTNWIYVFHMIPRTWVPNCILGLLMPASPIPVAACLLRLQVRIPLEAWLSVPCECCVLSGRGLCDRPITSPEESYWVWCVWGSNYTRLLYTLLTSEFSRQLVGKQRVS